MPRLLPPILLSLSLVFGAAPPAGADGGEDLAREWFRRGEAAFSVGDYRGALRAYRRAYEEDPIPAFLFNVAQCHRNLGEYAEAIEAFRRYRSLAPDAENRASVERTIAELERELEQQRRREQSRRLFPAPAERSGSDEGEGHEEGGALYRSPWFWATVAVVAGATAAGAYAFTREPSPPPTDFGNTEFGR